MLQMYAIEWSRFLYTLRDGREAILSKVTHTVDDKGIVSTNHILVARFPPRSDDAQRLLKALPPKPPNGEWFVNLPILPAPELWESFKHVRTIAGMRRVLFLMEKRVPESDRAALKPHFKAARERCADIIKAKGLPHYPRRPGSDHRRIDFFAKVLAGLAFGLTPLTSTKRLSNWSPTTSFIGEGNIPPQEARGVMEVRFTPPRKGRKAK